MIVGASFDGDDDTEIAFQQHEVCGQALSIIVDTCNRLTGFAKAVLDAKTPESFGTVCTFDHRTLQHAHDLLAAAWRFRHDQRQQQLPLERRPEPLVSHTPANHWLKWLRGEIEAWVRSPQLVRLVQLVLTNQNQPEGYISETKLSLAILDRYGDVPWQARMREILERVLEDEASEYQSAMSPRAAVTAEKDASE